MRNVFLLLVTAVVAVVAGCGSQGREQARASHSERDVTLPTLAPEVVIASPVELHLLRIPQTPRRSRPTTRPAPAPRNAKAEWPAAPASAPTVLAPADPEAATSDAASEPLSDRELPPGKTVTLVPASSGPSTAPEWTEDFPTTSRGTIVRAGGGCPPRRPGIGIATRPRPSLY